MRRFKKIIVGVLIASVLLQPLGLVTPVLAAEVRMDYTDPEHIHAPKVVNGVS